MMMNSLLCIECYRVDLHQQTWLLKRKPHAIFFKVYLFYACVYAIELLCFTRDFLIMSCPKFSFFFIIDKDEGDFKDEKGENKELME